MMQEMFSQLQKQQVQMHCEDTGSCPVPDRGFRACQEKEHSKQKCDSCIGDTMYSQKPCNDVFCQFDAASCRQVHVDQKQALV